MNRLAKRVVVALLPSLVAVAAFGQNWPKPSKSQNTEVTCSDPCTGKDGGVLPPAPLRAVSLIRGTNDTSNSFVARGHDGQRSLMAKFYMLIGFDGRRHASFFTRLSSGEALMPATAIPLSVASTGRKP